MSYSAKVTFTLTSVHILQKPFADLIIGGGEENQNINVY